MKIIGLTVENIKRIKAIDIKPDGNTVIISGKNGNGKSSTIDSIAMALGGKKLIPERPVREGEETAKIEVDLGPYKVTRHWTNPTTSYLKLETKEGAKISNGQNVLNHMVGELTFDPLEFALVDASKRLQLLKTITKIDFSHLDERYKKTFERRTEVNRDIKSLHHRLESEFNDISDVLPETRSIEEIKAERQEIQDWNSKIEKLKSNKQLYQGQIDQMNSSISSMETEVKELQRKIKEANKRKDDFVENIKAIDEFLEQSKPKDDSHLEHEMEQCYQAKAVKGKIEHKKQVEEELVRREESAKAMTALLDNIKQERIRMVSEAEMPIEGLGFGDKDVEFNGIPFVQLSMAEQIKVSMSIAIAMNPKLRIAMIHNGSLLDADSMDYISKMADQNDIQVWVEKVADKPDQNAIFIEDGKVIH